MPTKKSAPNPQENLHAARERLANAEGHRDAVQRSQPKGAFGYEGWAADDARARADVAEATAALRLAEHACKIDDADANTLRALLRAEVLAAKTEYERTSPAPPVLAAYTPDAVAAHVTAVVACVNARAENEKRIDAARLRLRLVIASVYDARQLLVSHRQATGGVLPPLIVPNAGPGNRTPLPFDVPCSADECDALIDLLDAALPEPDLSRLAYEADALREQADEIQARSAAAE